MGIIKGCPSMYFYSGHKNPLLPFPSSCMHRRSIIHVPFLSHTSYRQLIDTCNHLLHTVHIEYIEYIYVYIYIYIYI